MDARAGAEFDADAACVDSRARLSVRSSSASLAPGALGVLSLSRDLLTLRTRRPSSRVLPLLDLLRALPLVSVLSCPVSSAIASGGVSGAGISACLGAAVCIGAADVAGAGCVAGGCGGFFL